MTICTKQRVQVAIASGEKSNSMKKKILFLGLGILILMMAFFFVRNNDEYYKRTIVKIIGIQEEKGTLKKGPNGELEQYFVQTIKAKVTNHERKGDLLEFKNEYSQTGYKTEKYSINDRLFVSLSEEQPAKEVTVWGMKRDYILVLLIGLFVLSLSLVAGSRGFLTLFSIVINLLVFVFGIRFIDQPELFSKYWIIMLALFCVITLVFASGFHIKTWGAVVASLLTMFLVWILFTLVTTFSQEPPYELMEYISGPHELATIFLASVLTGSLGAIMDVAITIHAGIGELVSTTPEISIRDMIQSIREIGIDIMGTMINVLFFVYLSGSLTGIFIEIRSGFGLDTILKFDLVFELIRFLLGAIGIVLAIPVSGVIAFVLFRRKLSVRRKTEC